MHFGGKILVEKMYLGKAQLAKTCKACEKAFKNSEDMDFLLKNAEPSMSDELTNINPITYNNNNHI